MGWCLRLLGTGRDKCQIPYFPLLSPQVKTSGFLGGCLIGSSIGAVGGIGQLLWVDVSIFFGSASLKRDRWSVNPTFIAHPLWICHIEYLHHHPISVSSSEILSEDVPLFSSMSAPGALMVPYGRVLTKLGSFTFTVGLGGVSSFFSLRCWLGCFLRCPPPPVFSGLVAPPGVPPLTSVS